MSELSTYLGTQTYMAPEIIEHKEYDGLKADIFSLGVILFIMIQGTFPFSQARTDEYYYKYLVRGETEKYFKKTGSADLSDDLKDLLVKMFSQNPAERPSIEEIKNHPWMQQEFDANKARLQLLQQIIKKEDAAKTEQQSGKSKKVSEVQ